MKTLMWIAFIAIVGYYASTLMNGAGDVGHALAKSNSVAKYSQMLND